MSKPSIAQLIHKRGSGWLKSKLLYADRKLLILNKPSGLITQTRHDAIPHATNKRAKYNMNDVFADIRKCFSLDHDPFPVHRLDKATTGCLVLALDPQTARSLSQRFADGKVKKEYLAIVRGGEKSFPSRSGRIVHPILYSDGRGELQQGSGFQAGGRNCITEWRLLGSSETAPVSLVKLNLVTGSKHQLRIHLAMKNQTPILGDTLYSRKPLSKQILKLVNIPPDGIFLHAWHISFMRHQTNTGDPYSFGVRAPLSLDFRKTCKGLGLDIDDKGLEKALLVNDDVIDSDGLNEYTKDYYWAFTKKGDPINQPSKDENLEKGIIKQ